MQPIPGICVRVYVSEPPPQAQEGLSTPTSTPTSIPTPESLLTLADGVLGPYEAIHEQASTSYVRHYQTLKQGLQLHELRSKEGRGNGNGRSCVGEKRRMDHHYHHQHNTAATAAVIDLRKIDNKYDRDDYCDLEGVGGKDQVEGR